MTKRTLPDGVYEHVITRDLRATIGTLGEHRQAETRTLDEADSHEILARHLMSEVSRALDALPAERRQHAQVQIVNRLLSELGTLVPKASDSVASAYVDDSAELLRAVYREALPERPSSPMASSTLLTRNRAEPSLSAELNGEIASADRIDVIVAFITMTGVRALRDAIERFASRTPSGSLAPRLRILTTVFTGTTELAAVESLARLPGVSVKVSYDIRRTRLHAKAWLFHRESELHTAYVGSANLTATALGSGQEWMVKVCAADLPQVIEKFKGTFEALWNDPEFEAFDPGSAASRTRLSEALHLEDGGAVTPLHLFTLRPFPFQQEILDRLEAERVVHARRRNLVVAATGTGKTVIAAFDYRAQADKKHVPPRLLFLAHREEILKQAMTTFRHVMQDGAFGELLVGGQEPTRWQHVFASIQTAANRDLSEKLGPEHFEYVVVDECHHTPADSYQAVVPKLRSDILLGLTATPERSDGKSLLPDFDGHIAAELRIWHALERQLLVPFEYYGVSDNVDLSRVRWSRTGYDQEELAQVYTGNEARVELILSQLQKRVADPSAIRGIAFCVSVAHAEYMAESFSTRGIRALAVHGNTPSTVRADAPRRLREREVSILCTCDLYNEGVDLPFVDTLLLLRPTMSATLFLQQLGRGLRLDKGKLSCLVLDFIGRHRTEFRFDALYAALTGIPRATLAKSLEAGFPYLPSGCVLQLDAVARDQVLASLRTNLNRRARLVDELRELNRAVPQGLSLAAFLEATGREVEDVYSDAGGWSTLRADAGAIAPLNDELSDLSRKLGWLLHVDDRTRLQTWSPAKPVSKAQPEYEQRRYAMLAHQLEPRGVLKTADKMAQYLASDDRIVRELRELSKVLDERISLAAEIYPEKDWPLALHRHYSRREILAAVGYVIPGRKTALPQGGILKLEDSKRELMFVTLDKSGKSFSPTTRYRDHAISPTLFHWETQSWTSTERASGQRYVKSATNGWAFHLFVRPNPDASYAYAGPATYQSHEGDRPIAITWQLRHPLAAGLFQQWSSLLQG